MMNVKLAWEKKGQIFNPKLCQRGWMAGYAQNPNVLELDDRLRIYFTTRPPRGEDGSCTSITTFADFEKDEPFKLIRTADAPILDLGGPGDFDEFGIMPGSIIRGDNDGEVLFYYVGWTRLTTVPYKWSLGLAVSNDNGETFERYSRGPIVSSSPFDPYLQACPRVLRRGPGDYFMWYSAGTGWNECEGHFESVYVTKSAVSGDGRQWRLINEQYIPSKVPHECQTSASYIVIEGLHHMFFSYRHGIGFRSKDKGYRIGYMHSPDGKSWTRDDDLAGISISDNGWDSEMLCYPHVVQIGDAVYMFYCGNNFGEDGFGYAKLVK